MNNPLITLAALLGLCLGIVSCSQVPPPPPAPTYAPGSYEEFISKSKKYPANMEVYLNDELLKAANGKNSKVSICLDQQRGRLYVMDTVAADWPVSTGVVGRETPTGSFRIRLKKKEHASNRYGKMYDAEGKCINRDADAFKDPVPEGGRFEGSPMPNWMRLTSDGVGMHTGKVRAGKRLSHGCIRTPHMMATKLFDITEVGTRVNVTQGLEPTYTAQPVLAERAAADKREEEEAAKAAAEAARRKKEGENS